MEKYKKQQSKLEDDLLAHGSADYDFKITLPVVKSMNDRTGEIFKSSKSHEKRAILNYLLSNPTLYEKKLYFTIASLFSDILKLDESLNWCME